jgi:recombinational DNA repair protein (RecF pathway)
MSLSSPAKPQRFFNDGSARAEPYAAILYLSRTSDPMPTSRAGHALYRNKPTFFQTISELYAALYVPEAIPSCVLQQSKRNRKLYLVALECGERRGERVP